MTKKETNNDEEAEVIEEEDDEKEIIYQKNQCSKTNLVDYFPKNFDLSKYHNDLSGMKAILIYFNEKCIEFQRILISQNQNPFFGDFFL